MDRSDAMTLATRLEQALGEGDAEPIHSNPHAGVDAGWVARWNRPDGSHVDVFGSERSGYQITSRTLGWQSFDRLVDELRLPVAEQVDERSPTNDDDLLDRITKLAVGLAELGSEARAIRDELALRARR